MMVDPMPCDLPWTWSEPACCEQRDESQSKAPRPHGETIFIGLVHLLRCVDGISYVRNDVDSKNPHGSGGIGILIGETVDLKDALDVCFSG